MLDEAHIYIETAPWFVVFPGVAIVLTVLSLNLVGDALRDLADPHAVAARRGVSRTSRGSGVRGLPEPAQE